MSSSPPDTADGCTTFPDRQLAYRAKVSAFFANQTAYNRLGRIVHEGEEIYSVLMFFVTEYSRNRVFQTPKGIFCPNDSYRYALRSHLKRFYNFESRPGQGDLCFEGIRNPRVLANGTMGPIALTLPRLVAVMWLIENDFDVVFWSRYDDVRVCNEAYTLSKKKKYTEAHKKKKKLLRQRIEQSVIQKREERKKDNIAATGKKRRRAAGGKPTGKRKETRLSREDRKTVVRMISEEKKKIRKAAREARAKLRKREAKEKHKVGFSAMAVDVAAPLVVDF